MRKQKTVFKVRKACNPGKETAVCRHDYKNAIQIGNIDYVCPLCKELLDPLEWFLMNSFEFVEVDNYSETKKSKN
ncbi:MAG: hypothetical protein HZA48_03170 [Planctomycetes bacterium]|nr:hypothetical protein [Planctomycetota bacterium]